MLWSWKLHPSAIVILSQLSFLIISALFKNLLWASFLSATLIPEFLVSSASVSICLQVKVALSSLPIDFSWYLNYLNFLKKKKKRKRRKRKTRWLSSNVYIHFKCLDMFITFKVLVGKNMWNHPKRYFNDILQLLFHFYEGVFPCIALLCSTVFLPWGCQAGVPAPCRCPQLGVKEESGHLLHHICTTRDQPSQGPKCAPMERKNTSGKTAWNCPWVINFH